ncbi:MAG: class I SAM-dependent methyltransferase [Chloroflexi bacterium]|nr:class I SAM-dependent methyltransferase [Chloroflexota bacterium]
MSDAHTKQEVRQFYDRIGWNEGSEGFYQNARYEDLRSVSHGYIHRCHLRVNRYLPPKGQFLLDAGCGPIQYPEYLTYSAGYRYRVCVDISIVALQEARTRIGKHGLFVVADVANLPFKSQAFDGIVSLHTLHHVSIPDQKKSYNEFQRLMKPGASSVVVNGWKASPLMRRMQPLIKGMERLFGKNTGKSPRTSHSEVESISPVEKEPTGTYVQKLTAQGLREMLKGMDFEIRCWRSVSVRFLRAVIQPALLGSFWLWLLYYLEEAFPRLLGEKGQYPMVILRKSE